MIKRIAAAVAADYGPEAWARLSEAEQSTAACAHAGDCMQHLRNIMLDSMSAAATAHLKETLEDSLADFSSFERMSTDAMQLIRAMYVAAPYTATLTHTSPKTQTELPACRPSGRAMGACPQSFPPLSLPLLPPSPAIICSAPLLMLAQFQGASP